jgi:hypothetical protein
MHHVKRDEMDRRIVTSIKPLFVAAILILTLHFTPRMFVEKWEERAKLFPKPFINSIG